MAASGIVETFVFDLSEEKSNRSHLRRDEGCTSNDRSEYCLRIRDKFGF